MAPYTEVTIKNHLRFGLSDQGRMVLRLVVSIILGFLNTHCADVVFFKEYPSALTPSECNSPCSSINPLAKAIAVPFSASWNIPGYGVFTLRSELTSDSALEIQSGGYSLLESGDPLCLILDDPSLCTPAFTPIGERPSGSFTYQRLKAAADIKMGVGLCVQQIANLSQVEKDQLNDPDIYSIDMSAWTPDQSTPSDPSLTQLLESLGSSSDPSISFSTIEIDAECRCFYPLTTNLGASGKYPALPNHCSSHFSVYQ